MSALAWIAVASLAAWGWLLLCQGFFWRTDQRLPRRENPVDWPAVVVVVPARDEAEVLPESLPSLLGAQGDERVAAEEWARRLHTINYEITCGIGRRVPREHHRGDGAGR